MAKTIQILASYIGEDVTSVDIYDNWPDGTLLSGSFSRTNMIDGVQLADLSDSIFSFVLVDTVTSASSTKQFLPGPNITDFNPKSAPSGDTVTVDGTGLFGATSVTVGTINAGFGYITDEVLEFTVPQDASGSNQIIISTPTGLTQILGWQYETELGPVVYSLGDFAYDQSSFSAACASQINQFNLFSIDGININQVYQVLGRVYSDVNLTQTPPQGWYSGNSAIGVYYVNSGGFVDDFELCPLDEGPIQ